MVAVAEEEAAAAMAEGSLILVVVEEEAAAAMAEGSLILVSTLDTEVAAVKEQVQELFVRASRPPIPSTGHDFTVKKLIFNAVKNLSGNAEPVLSSCCERSTDGEVKIRMNTPKTKRDSTPSNALELTSDETRSSACKMVKIPISLMRALDFDAMAEVPEDEPPCFKFCDDNKNPLMIKVGNIYNKHIIISLKDYYALSMDSATVANFQGKLKLCTRIYEAQEFMEKIMKEQESYEKQADCEKSDCTQDTYCEVELTAHPIADAFSNLPEILREMVNDDAGKTLSLQKTKSQAYYALSMDCATIANFRCNTEKIMKEQDRHEKHTDSERSVNPCLHAMKAIGYILCINPTAKKYWCIDSGASSHISGKSEWVTNVRPVPKEKSICFLNAASKEVRFSGIGDVVGPKVRLYNVYISNDLEDGELFISIGQLTGEGYTVLIDMGEVTIRLATNFNHIVGRGSLDKIAKVYKLEFFNGSVLEKGKGDLAKVPGPGYKLAKGEWVLDSGCHNHITCEKSFLNNKWKMKRGKKFGVAGSKQVLSSKVKGNITEGEVRLNDVYLCEQFQSNIISVCQLDVLGYNFLFSSDHCHIRYKKEKNLVGLAHVDGGNLNYYVEFLHLKE